MGNSLVTGCEMTIRVREYQNHHPDVNPRVRWLRCNFQAAALFCVDIPYL
jgi:hypothetical protein